MWIFMVGHYICPFGNIKAPITLKSEWFAPREINLAQQVFKTSLGMFLGNGNMPKTASY